MQVLKLYASFPGMGKHKNEIFPWFTDVWTMRIVGNDKILLSNKIFSWENSCQVKFLFCIFYEEPSKTMCIWKKFKNW